MWNLDTRVEFKSKTAKGLASHYPVVLSATPQFSFFPLLWPFILWSLFFPFLLRLTSVMIRYPSWRWMPSSLDNMSDHMKKPGYWATSWWIILYQHGLDHTFPCYKWNWHRGSTTHVFPHRNCIPPFSPFSEKVWGGHLWDWREHFTPHFAQPLWHSHSGPIHLRSIRGQATVLSLPHMALVQKALCHTCTFVVSSWDCTQPEWQYSSCFLQLWER